MKIKQNQYSTMSDGVESVGGFRVGEDVDVGGEGGGGGGGTNLERISNTRPRSALSRDWVARISY